MRDNGISAGALFAPDNEAVRAVVDAVPGVYGLHWANPRLPGYLEQAARATSSTAGSSGSSCTR